MTYARKGPKSDVYVFRSGSDDLIHCFACSLAEGITADPSPGFESAELMIAHLEKHIEEGERVPDEALARLRAETSPVVHSVYLCAWIVVEETIIEGPNGRISVADRPVVKRIGIFSEPSPEPIGKGVWACMLAAKGSSSAEATKALRSSVEQALPWLSAHVQWELA